MLDYVRELLHQRSDNAYDLLIDEDLAYGADLRDFMDLLDQVDAVLLILTPAYKRKVAARQGGVYREYTKICQRHQSLQEAKRSGQPIADIHGYFELVPIVLSGDAASSVPDDIMHLKHLVLTGLRVTRDSTGQYVNTDYNRRMFVPEVTKIAERLRLVSSLRARDFTELYDDYYKRLFKELKADWNNPRDIDHDYIESLFVKTFAYRRIERQDVYFMIGRKGSGKSTVAGILHHRNPERYLGHVAIIADDFDLDTPYAFFASDQVVSDTRTIVSRRQAFQFAWEAFLHICCIELLLNVVNADEAPVTANDRDAFRHFLDHILPTRDEMDEAERRKTYFTYTFTSVVEYLNDCIRKARPDTQLFYADIQARFSRKLYLKFALGDDVFARLESVLRNTVKPILFTLDGFDSTFDKFRRPTNLVQNRTDLESRTEFEIDWLRALLQLVLSLKEGSHRSPLQTLSHLCMTVPQDRFFDVLATERDSYRYHNRFCSLNWSGIELSILLRKRLQELAQASSDKTLRPDERLRRLLQRHYPHLPEAVDFEFNGRKYEMSLFLYVLRHTFWRPRDILLYYAKILAASEELRRHRVDVTPEIIRRAVKDVTYEIVSSEFINEFAPTITNIETVVGAFARKTQFLSYQEIADIVGPIEFGFAIATERRQPIQKKLEVLYEIGFIGIDVNNDLRQRSNVQHEHAFYFNEGTSLLRTKAQNPFDKFTFIIHPIFSEYLELDNTGRPLVLNLTWEYIARMEGALYASTAMG